MGGNKGQLLHPGGNGAAGVNVSIGQPMNSGLVAAGVSGHQAAFNRLNSGPPQSAGSMGLIGYPHMVRNTNDTLASANKRPRLFVDTRPYNYEPLMIDIQNHASVKRVRKMLCDTTYEALCSVMIYNIP